MGKIAHIGAAGRGSWRVSIVETIAAVGVLEAGWRALERRDPEGGFFLSHAWMMRVFAVNPGRWRVFAVHSGARLVALFPAKYRAHWSRSTERFQTEIEPGGRLGWSEYTGFLCEPGMEAEALPLIAEALADAPWVRLSIRYEPTGDRSRLFAAAFDPEAFELRWRGYIINGGQTDNLISPQVPLPRDFESYIRSRMSANTRQKLRRAIRGQLQTGRYRITAATPQTVRRDLDILLAHWQARWARDKGADTAATVAGNYRFILETAQDLGALHLPVLWQGDRPLGALGHVIDRQTGRSHFIVAGRDPQADDASIGLLLHASAIRWAIRQGLSLYDFGHGNESYKYSFGPEERRLSYLELRRRSGSTAGYFDPITMLAALARIDGFIAAGKTERAAAACVQLAEIAADQNLRRTVTEVSSRS
jgi:CelD/BcsL family acetyltransferase involved in cellulose biosynthesis